MGEKQSNQKNLKQEVETLCYVLQQQKQLLLKQ